jgi:glycosyltransferase involved in cell wall biosynthesis
MAEEVRRCVASNTSVEYMGSQPSESVYREMARAKFLIFPSEWFETFGRTVVEAFSQGTPVLAADLGGIRELVEEGITGYCFPPGNADALITAALRFPGGEAYERMQTNCRNLFSCKFTAEINYTALTGIYARAIAARRKGWQSC